MGNQQTIEKIAQEIAKKQISNVSFNFRSLSFDDGKPIYKIYQCCQICGKQRFTEDEAKELSDKNLSFDTFMDKYRKHQYCNSAICNEGECNNTLYLLSAGFNNYMLHTTFDHKDMTAWLAKNPGKTLHD